ncbi:MAG TPA: alpha/beta hydrolase [Thermoanaerobaculia bacterium]|nr:alpha/beta hydrolase [Thermoanaerobaculia bacterium]
MRITLALSALALLLFLSGCVSLRPFDEVRRAFPEDRFLRIGDQLVYVERTGDGGDPIVLIHGFGGSVYSWRKVVPALAEKHQVVAIDLSGFGYTQRPGSPGSYTREAQGRLVLAVLDALGIERAHIFGHSYGGGLTLSLAARHPERFLSMVLVDSSAPTYSDDRRNRVAGIRPLATVFLRSVALRPSMIRRALLRSYYDDSQVTPELVRAYLDRLRIEGVADAYQGLTAPARPGERVELEKIDVPALVVWGAQDELISLESGRRAAARMPRSEFVVIDECGHLPMEEKPEELLRVVLPFLESQGD